MKKKFEKKLKKNKQVNHGRAEKILYLGGNFFFQKNLKKKFFSKFFFLKKSSKVEIFTMVKIQNILSYIFSTSCDQLTN